VGKKLWAEGPYLDTTEEMKPSEESEIPRMLAGRGKEEVCNAFELEPHGDGSFESNEIDEYPVKVMGGWK
jgi:hypothetical protein